MGESPQTCLAAGNQSVSNVFSKIGTGARHPCHLGLLGSGLASEGLEGVNFLSLSARQALLDSKGLLGQALRRQSHGQKSREVGTGHSGLRSFLKEGSLKQTWVVSSREPDRATWM